MNKLNVATIIAGLEDAGVFQRADDMRTMLKGTEDMRDSNPRVAYYWGWLECLETQELLAAQA